VAEIQWVTSASGLCLCQ